MADLNTIADFYENETGLNAKQGPNRLLEIEIFLNETGLTLEDVEVKETSDWQWPKRRNRTEFEKNNRQIGSTTRGSSYNKKYYFVHQREA